MEAKIKKALYKLMNNFIFGKTMENIRNTIDIKLASSKKDYLKWTSKPRYISHKIFDNDLVPKLKIKLALMLSKPACIGMWILKLIERLMFEFHYDYIRNECDNNSRLLFKDSNSLMYEI